jgi:Fe-S cluster assembly protein SufB
MSSPQVALEDYKYGFHYEDKSVFKTRKGLDEQVVRDISNAKKEPEWMLEYRLRGLQAFNSKPMPSWGADLSDIDFDEIYYYAKPTEEQAKTWEDLPADIKETYDRLGIPEAEQKFLSGVGAQYDSEVVYHSIKEEISKLGVLFLSPEQAIEQYPEIVKQYFGTIIPYNDNKFAALNTAVWSGGSFVYVPKGVRWSR